ncbi:MAG: (d)CMP kinase [Chloroflexi bacterium]|nr:(d)CMP kinase [Chloroflexota bacterium]MYG90810.1 (d)CMP kinase [Chloroflexota bacterium]MYJ93258.1 (d)CMP kinase [Chloroflexota bacterium]
MAPSRNPDCRNRLVAIDGPVASGKTAVGRALAKRLGWRLFDTGIMYRAATWQAQRKGVHLDEEDSVAELIRAAEFHLSPRTDADSVEMDVFVDGDNATPHLRQPQVESGVPIVAANAGVRELMVAIQQSEAAQGCMIVVGRDIGTVVLPEAPVKIFLDASEEVRARRRAAEQYGGADEATVLKATQRRDRRDRGRAASPLIVAANAVRLDTSDLSLDQAIDAAETIVRERLPDLAIQQATSPARQR